MAQHDYVIANGTGAAVRSDLNNALAAIVSQNSGATEPATTYAYQWWADTTTNLLKLRNSANSGWITLFQLDGEYSTIALENGTAAAPSIYFKDSGTDTGFYSPGANQVGISTGGTARLTIDSNGNVDIDSNTLYVDATNNRVGLGTSSPSHKLVVSQNNSGGVAAIHLPEDESTILGSTANTNIKMGGNLTLSAGSVWMANTNGSERLRITSAGNVGIGTTGPTQRFQVTDGTLSNFFVAPGYNSGQGTTLAVGGGEYIEFATNGITNPRARIDSSGRLLVGTSSSRDKLFGASGEDSTIQLEGLSGKTAAVSIVRNSNDNSSGRFILGKSRSASVGGYAAVQSGDQVGFISFQGADGTNLLETARIESLVDGTPGTNDMPGRLVFSVTADGASSPSEAMRIINNKTLLVGKTAQGLGNDGCEFSATTNRMTMPSGNYLEINKTTGTNQTLIDFQIAAVSKGSISYNGTNVAYNTSSDYRLKENVVLLTGAADRLNQIPVHRFNFISSPDKIVDGFIAHEVQSVVPEAIYGEKDAVDADGNPVYQGIDQSKLVPLLTAALQEALAEIESLKARVAALEP